ncbi:MAG: hypothetical protein IJ663_02600 [Spirochaetales bacterium]|nr:hypothetical protein [Spirochaetales bacterium]
MKRFLILVLAIFMVFAMVACKSEPEEEGGGSALPVSEEESKQALIDQGSSASGGKGIKVDHTGFSFDINAVNNGEAHKIYLGGKDDIFWVGAEVDAVTTYAFYTEKAGKAYMMLSSYPVWIEVSQGVSLKESIFQTADSFLFWAHTAEEYLIKGADDTVGDRICATYSATVPIPETKQTASVKFYVDKTWGVTLKVVYEDPSLAESFSLSVDPKYSNPTLPTGYETAKSTPIV